MRKNTILLFGLGGTGKTVACMSLLKIPGMKVRMLLTDSNSISGIEAGLKIHKITLNPGDLIVMQPFAKSDKAKVFSQAVADRTTFLRNSSEDNYKVKVSANDRMKYQNFLNVQKGMAKFIGVDWLTKEEVDCGNIGESSWDENVTLCIDGLTTISEALKAEILCGRKNMQISDYGDVQNNLGVFINEVTSFTDCSVVMLGHAKIAEAELSSQEVISIALPGTSLAGQITGYFANTIFCENINGERFWHGVAKNRKINLSVRDIPEKERLIPDFSLPEYTFFN